MSDQVFTPEEVLNIRAANGYDYANPQTDPRLDFANWPLIKIGDLAPQRGIELNYGGNTSFQLYTNTISTWLKTHPDPALIASPEPEPYDLVAALKRIEKMLEKILAGGGAPAAAQPVAIAEI